MNRPQAEVNATRWRLMALLYLAIFLVILVLAYTKNLPGYLNAIPYYDKIGHVVLYCVATYLGHRVLNYRHWRWGKWLLPWFPILFALFTLGEELVQGLSPNRTLDSLDLLFSGIGIVLGYGLAQRSRQVS